MAVIQTAQGFEPLAARLCACQGMCDSGIAGTPWQQDNQKHDRSWQRNSIVWLNCDSIKPECDTGRFSGGL